MFILSASVGRGLIGFATILGGTIAVSACAEGGGQPPAAPTVPAASPSIAGEPKASPTPSAARPAAPRCAAAEAPIPTASCRVTYPNGTRGCQDYKLEAKEEAGLKEICEGYAKGTWSQTPCADDFLGCCIVKELVRTCDYPGTPADNLATDERICGEQGKSRWCK